MEREDRFIEAYYKYIPKLQIAYLFSVVFSLGAEWLEHLSNILLLVFLVLALIKNVKQKRMIETVIFSILTVALVLLGIFSMLN